MAVEDFTTYTEVDEDSDITVTTTKCDVDTMRLDALSYVRSDKDANHFGEFEHLVTVHLGTGIRLGFIGFWGLSNGSNTEQQMEDNDEGLIFFMYSNDVDQYKFYVLDYTLDNHDDYVASADTTYYLAIERSSTTLTCKIYSDPTRETLVDTLTITCGEELYRYVYGVMSRESGTYPSLSGYSENLDLQEEAPPPTVGRSFGCIIG